MNDLFPKGKAHKLMTCSLLLSENNLICLLTPFLISLSFKTKFFVWLGILENVD